ncbi:DUF262 domain-containing protein (plasmid) [Entomospira nematocerorum]|uniref:DUF262 domain-containing protein n=1 Tax=Entomospira nematocerorum TaxID=2719987 RepID=A0A968GGA2_9SPIO|nr:DUF262 domain-containing protein [Entomospira nematocera]NIZ47728.1 DUF262 domain-containing protein [Entomospira nematocera]WDI34655.1 DUF262 domain-containing protein [Entomospira nematocera]
MPNATHYQTLLSLLDTYYLEIPIIQRDYAQGRADKQVTAIRKVLLADIHQALRESTYLDLNFVYGKVKEQTGHQPLIFIPIDGQQRLTTLWLLHLYAFHNDKKVLEKLARFSYKTRKSSRQFLEHLVKHCQEVITSTLLPSQEIEDSAWFLPAWQYDPTIASMLTMLDHLHEVFKDFAETTKLELKTQLQAGYLRFRFLDTKSIGSEDDLYIKLNGRGKSLSPFDNVKSIIIEQIILHEEELKQVHDIDRWAYSQFFDREWTDYFWHRSKENFDTDFLLFLTLFFHNYHIIDNREDGWWFSFDKTQMDATFLMTLYHTLNFIISDNAAKVAKFIPKTPDKDKDYAHAIASYTVESQLLFYLVTQYCAMAKTATLNPDFMEESRSKQWFRILWNLIINSNNNLNHMNIIKKIDEFSTQWYDLLGYFAGDQEIKGGFHYEQIKEERIKAKIILKHPDKDAFSQAIYLAEAHPYFLGQIQSALYLSFTNEEKDVTLISLDKFHRYWQTLSTLFADTTENKMHVVRRALLSYYGDKDDYRLSVDSQRTFCVTAPRNATSLRALFAKGCNKPKLRQFLDDLTLEQNMTEQLENKIRTYLVEHKDKPLSWRDCMMTYEALWNKMRPSLLYSREFGKKFLLLKNSVASGRTYEVFITSLSIELEKVKQQLIEKGLSLRLKGTSARSDHRLEIFTTANTKDIRAIIRYDYTQSCFTIDIAGDKQKRKALHPNSINKTVEYILEHYI